MAEDAGLGVTKPGQAATFCCEGTIHLWEINSGQVLRRIVEPCGLVWSLAFAPDGRTLAAGGGDSTILLWDLTGSAKDGKKPVALTKEELQGSWSLHLTVGTPPRHTGEPCGRWRGRPQPRAMPFLKEGVCGRLAPAEAQKVLPSSSPP